MTNKLLVYLIVALLVGFGIGYYANSNKATVGSTNFSPAQTEVNPFSFANGMSIGQARTTYFDKNGVFNMGGVTVATSTTGSTDTLLVTQLTNYNNISYTPNVTAVTLTLPATSTIGTSFIPNAGDMAIKTLTNASTSLATITLAAGTGEALEGTTSPTVTYSRSVIMTFLRKANTDISVFLQN